VKTTSQYISNIEFDLGKGAKTATAFLETYGDVKTMIHKLHVALNVEEHQVTPILYSMSLFCIDFADKSFIILCS
jgi:hypothetical protein